LSTTLQTLLKAKGLRGKGAPPPPPPQSVKVFKTGIAHGDGHFADCYHYFTSQVQSDALVYVYISNEGVSGFVLHFYGTPLWAFALAFNWGNIYNEYAGGDLISAYTLNHWEKVRVAWNCTTHKFQVWLNDVYKGEFNMVYTPAAINAIAFETGGDEITAQTSYWDDVSVPADTGALLTDDFHSGTPPADPPGWTVIEDSQCRVELSNEQGH